MLGTTTWLRTVAAAATPRIPGAKLVTIERGGHIFMGHDNEVREAIRAFLQTLM